MNPIKKIYDERKKEFEEKFECIQSNCDGNGIVPVQKIVDRQLSDTEQVPEIEWEATQCEFHARYLFPILASQKSDILATIEAVEEWAEGKVKGKPCLDDYDEGFIDAFSDLLQFLKEAKTEINQSK